MEQCKCVMTISSHIKLNVMTRLRLLFIGGIKIEIDVEGVNPTNAKAECLETKVTIEKYK